jgi:hypothetical protein
MKLWESQNKNMESGNLFAIAFPGRLGRNSFLVMKNKFPVPIAFFHNQQHSK